MGISSSTKTIPEFVLNYIKFQNSIGNIITRTDIKNALRQALNQMPWMFGTSNNGSDVASWESSIYPTFRSMYSRAKNGSGGSKGLEDIKIITKDGIDYVFHIDTFLMSSIGFNLGEIYGGGQEKISKDPHTTLQFMLCSIGRKAGYKLFVPNNNRTSFKADNGLTIGGEFSNDLVDDFIGYNDITRQIDVIFLEKTENGYLPIRSFEVENSTSVVTGLTRIKSLGVNGCIISTQKSYKNIFDKQLEHTFTELQGKVKYIEGSRIFKMSEDFEEYEKSFSEEEIREHINTKL
jgi:hypothetical protein